MGWLTYGIDNTVELDDASLMLLDALIAKTRGRVFQLHLVTGEPEEHRLRAMTIAPGVPIVLDYSDSPDLFLNLTDLDECIERVDDGYFVELPVYREHQLVQFPSSTG